jgi:hypothetical protein
MGYVIDCELNRTTPGRRFSEDGYKHYKVRLGLKVTGADSLDAIEMVVFELDPTFEEKYVVSDNRRQNFAVDLWTYGWFPVAAKLLTVDNRVLNVRGEVRWTPPPWPEDEEEDDAPPPKPPRPASKGRRSKRSTSTEGSDY